MATGKFCQIKHNAPWAQGIKKTARAGFQQRISGVLAFRRTSSANLASFSSGFNRALRIIFEIISAHATDFPTDFRSPLRILSKITGTTPTLRHKHSSLR